MVMADSLAAVVAGEWAVVGPPPGRPWGRRPRRRAQSGSGDEGVAGLVDSGGDVGAVDRAVGGDGDGAAGQVDGDRLDAVDGGDLLGDRALAVLAGHAGDGEGGRADEGAGRAGQHGNSSCGGWWCGRYEESAREWGRLTGEIAGIRRDRVPGIWWTRWVAQLDRRRLPSSGDEGSGQFAGVETV